MIKKSKVQTHLHTLKELRNQNSNTVHVIQLTEISWASYLWVIWQKETQKWLKITQTIAQQKQNNKAQKKQRNKQQKGARKLSQSSRIKSKQYNWKIQGLNLLLACARVEKFLVLSALPFCWLRFFEIAKLSQNAKCNIMKKEIKIRQEVLTLKCNISIIALWALWDDAPQPFYFSQLLLFSSLFQSSWTLARQYWHSRKNWFSCSLLG